MMVPYNDLRTQYHGIKPEIDAAILRVLESTQFALGEEVGRQIAPKLSSLPECTESELVMGAELSA